MSDLSGVDASTRRRQGAAQEQPTPFRRVLSKPLLGFTKRKTLQPSLALMEGRVFT